LKNVLFKNWGAARLIRLSLGFGLIVFGVITKGNAAFALMGGMFALQALLNLSCCCGGGSCPTGIDRAERYESGQDEK